MARSERSCKTKACGTTRRTTKTECGNDTARKRTTTRNCSK